MIKNGIMPIFFVFVLSSLFATTFEEVDFEKLILNHPMMKNYDRKTGTFNNTDYKFQDVENLKKEVEELAERLNIKKKQNRELSNKINSIANNTDGSDNEEEFWTEVNKNTKESDIIENEIDKKVELIDSNGLPSHKLLLHITNEISKDVLVPMYDKDKITLNNLPKNLYINYKPDYDFNPRNLLKTNNREFLKKYIYKTKDYVSIFPKSNNTIIYKTKEADVKSVGTVDLSLVMLLHPRMANFDFMNFGFNKYKLGLENEEYENVVKSIKEKAPSRKTDLENLEKEISKLHTERVAYYYKNFNQQTTELFRKKMEEFGAKDQDYQKQILDTYYADNFPELTLPDETIKILKEIYKDMTSAIQSVCKEKKLSLLLNQTIPYSFKHKIDYNFNILSGNGYAGINYMLFYSLYNKNNLAKPFNQMPKNDFSKRWSDLVCNNKNDYSFSFKPYPMVLSGGVNILSDIVKKFYIKYNIPESADMVLDSVLQKVDSYQDGFDY